MIEIAFNNGKLQIVMELPTSMSIFPAHSQ